MDRRAFLRLIGLGLAVGPEAIAEAMKPQIFYSIPASLGESAVTAETLSAYDAVLRHVYEGRVRELLATSGRLASLFNPEIVLLKKHRPPYMVVG